MDFKKHLENAWHITRKNLSSLFLLTTGFCIIFLTIPLTLALLSFPVAMIAICLLGAVMMPGYIHSVLMLIRVGRKPRLQDLFSQHQLIVPLTIFSIIVSIMTTTGFFFLYFPGVAVLCAVVFVCLYMIPLMVDRKMGIVDAIKISLRMAVKDNVADHWVIVILVIGLTTIGSSVFFGILFTQPFATVFTLLVYNEKIEGEQDVAS